MTMNPDELEEIPDTDYDVAEERGPRYEGDVEYDDVFLPDGSLIPPLSIFDL